MVATTWEKRPAGFFAVPLNMRCSRKWASPDFPGVSSADPTLYQIICVTTGARWSGMTTTSSPLSRKKCAICGPVPASAIEQIAASRTAVKTDKSFFSTNDLVEFGRRPTTEELSCAQPDGMKFRGAQLLDRLQNLTILSSRGDAKAEASLRYATRCPE